MTGEGVTFCLAAGGPTTNVLCYIPEGASLTDTSRITAAIATVYPDAVAQVTGLPDGMAIAILKEGT